MAGAATSPDGSVTEPCDPSWIGSAAEMVDGVIAKPAGSQPAGRLDGRIPTDSSVTTIGSEPGFVSRNEIGWGAPSGYSWPAARPVIVSCAPPPV